MENSGGLGAGLFAVAMKADNGVAERELSIPYVANAKKVAQWDLGRTLYDNNDRDLIRRR